MFHKYTENSRILLQASLCESDDLNERSFREKILNKMHINKVFFIDAMILLYGKTLFRRLGSKRYTEIRQKMRQLGRLLVQLRIASNSTKALTDFLSGTDFDTVVAAVENLVQIAIDANGDRIVRNPSLALKLGHSLKKYALMKWSQGSRDKEKESKYEADAFLELYDAEWTDNISSASLTSVQTRRTNSADHELPIKSDLDKLKSYQAQRIGSLLEILQINPNYE